MVVRLKREELRWEEQSADVVLFSRPETIQIEYKGKGYFSGKTHSFKATVTGQNGHQAHVIEGQWHTTSKSTKSSANFTDVTGPKEEVTVGISFRFFHFPLFGATGFGLYGAMGFGRFGATSFELLGSSVLIGCLRFGFRSSR